MRHAFAFCIARDNYFCRAVIFSPWTRVEHETRLQPDFATLASGPLSILFALPGTGCPGNEAMPIAATSRKWAAGKVTTSLAEADQCASTSSFFFSATYHPLCTFVNCLLSVAQHQLLQCSSTNAVRNTASSLCNGADSVHFQVHLHCRPVFCWPLKLVFGAVGALTVATDIAPSCYHIPSAEFLRSATSRAG